MALTFTKEVNLGTLGSVSGVLKLIVVENSINSTNNTSNVTATLQFIVNNGSWRASSASWSLSGYKSASGSLVSMQYYSGTTDLWTSTFDVAHDNSTGNATISFNFSFTSSATYGGNDSLSCVLTPIPRYAKITSFKVSKRDETSVIYSYTADSTLDYAWYSKDDGNTWTALPNSGIVSGLTAGTTYNFKLLVRRQDSQLTTVSNRYPQSTYDYPKPNSVSNFIIGSPATIDLYNPLGRSITLDLISNNNGSILGSYVGTGSGNITGFDNPTQITTQYNSIPDTPSGTYYARVTYGSIVKTKGTGTYSIKGSELPIITTTAVDTNKTLPDSNTPTNKIQDLTNDTTNKTIIRYISNVKVNVSGEGQYGTTINGNTYATQYGTQPSNAGDEYIYQNVESTLFTGYGTDRRGLTNSSTAPGLTLINYVKLTIDDLELYRDEQTSNTLKCRGNGNYFSGSFGTNGVNNSITFQVRAKEPNQSWDNINWVTKTVTIGSDDDYSFDFSIGTTYDYTKTYNVQVKATDKCMTSGILETVAKPGIPIQGLFENFHEAFGTKTFENTSNGVELNVDLIYPVGSIYMSVNSTNPSTYFGGTWVAWGTGRVPVGVDTNDTDFDTVEETGGEKTHTLTPNETAKHELWVNINQYASSGDTDVISIAGQTGGLQVRHNVRNEDGLNISTGANATSAHNIMQPYITCYMWKRTA